MAVFDETPTSGHSIAPLKTQRKVVLKNQTDQKGDPLRNARIAIQTSSHNPTLLFCEKNGHQCFDQVLPPNPTHRCPACGNIVIDTHPHGLDISFKYICDS